MFFLGKNYPQFCTANYKPVMDLYFYHKITKSFQVMSKKFTLLRLASTLVAVMLFAYSSIAQVTSSAISGRVTDSKNEVLPGATVVAVHTPSGSKYGTVTDVNGRFFLPGVRVGGPYEVKVTFIGFQDQSKSGIIANLGSTANVDFSLTDEGTTLTEVVVKSSKSDIFSSNRTGAATTVGKEAINALPTIGRTINDFTRLTPQGNGRSFSGQDSRLNNITIDGAVFNNGFGLGDQPGARTGIAPISLDAIEEVQVNVAPFDVRQTGFTGAGVNAVTRSGTNQFQGSIFTLMRNDSKAFIGRKANGEDVFISEFNKQVQGFRVGGPIIKDKLFFFANGEFETITSPGTTWLANRGQSGSNVTRVLASDLDRVSERMGQLGFVTGPYENFNFNTVGNKFLARVDWNINDKHKFNIRYSLLDGGSDNPISNSSSAGFGSRTNSANSMSYLNSGYILNEDLSSTIAELNSTLSNKLANNLIVGYTVNNEDRAYMGGNGLFPTIDILDGNNRTYISAGFDPFTPNNLLNYNTFQLFDNLTYFAGKHTVTAGVALERFVSNNSFYAASNGVYVYNSLNDFFAATDAYLANPNNPAVGASPSIFQYRFDFAGGAAPPLQTMKATTPGIYLQDEFQASTKLKLSLGLRVDIPFVEQTALENTVVTGLTFRDENGQPAKYNTGVLPSGNPLWSPRLGFNYDVKGDKTIQVRGGSGIFTGRPPFVWLSNQIGNNGILSGFTDLRNANAASIPFTLDPSRFRPATADPYAASTFDIAVADENYKFPQVWKTNIAADVKLPGGIIATGEFIFNQNINAVYYINANQKEITATFNGPDNRPRYAGNAAANRLNNNITNNIVLKSTNQGYSYSATAKLEKPFTNGFYAMAAYTFAEAKDLTSAGSIAAGSYTGNATVRGNNFPDLAFSNNDVRNRVIASASYKFNYGGEFGGSTQISMFYEGRNLSRYSYRYAGDMNQDGIFNNDLLYVPNKASDLIFLPLTTGGKTFSVAEQQAAFDAFINQDPYLSTIRGGYAERNGARLPFYNSIDLGIVQEFYLKAGANRHTLQVRADITNFANMLNNKWGVFTNTANQQPLSAAGVNAAGVPQYRMATQQIDGQTQLLRDSFVPSISTGSLWQAQLGLRYIFN